MRVPAEQIRQQLVVRPARLGHVGRARRHHRRDDAGDRPARRRFPRHLHAADLRSRVPRRPAEHAPAVQDWCVRARPPRSSTPTPRWAIRCPCIAMNLRHRQVPRDRCRRGIGLQLAPLRRRRLLLAHRRRSRRDRHGDLGHSRRRRWCRPSAPSPSWGPIPGLRRAGPAQSRRSSSTWRRRRSRPARSRSTS